MAYLLVVVAALLAYALARAVAFHVAFRRMELAIPTLPSMCSLPVLGHTLFSVVIAPDYLYTIMKAVWNHKYDLFSLSALGNLVIIVSDPDDIEEMLKTKEAQNKSTLFYHFLALFSSRGLIMSNGPVWRAHRRALQPAFHKDVLDRNVGLTAEECEGFCWRVKPGEEQDVTPNLMRVLVGSFMRTTLVSETSPEQQRAVGTLIHFMETFFPTVMRRTLSPWLWPDWAFGLTRAARESKRLRADVDRYSLSVIKRRRDALAAKQQQQQQQQQQSAAGELDAEQAVEQPTMLDIMLSSGEVYSDDDIVDEINMFAMAAVETTVAALGWTLKALSVRPDVQERVAREVADVLGDDGKVLDVHQLDRLEYTERVIKEAMRLHPPVPILGRETPVDTDMLGHRVPSGTTFVPNIHGVHRHPDHWPDPLRFDPDRFLPENCKGRHPYAYMPFSAGPRNCIGFRQAMLTMKTLIATIVQRFRVDRAADGFTDIAAFPEKLIITSYMLGGFRMKLVPRNQPVDGKWESAAAEAFGPV